MFFSILYIFSLFPTSLCGVLVFRLDPAGAAFASPSAASSSSLPHHSLAHSLTHSFTHSLTRVAGAVQIASWLPLAWQAQYTEPLAELRRAWAPLARGWLSRGRRSTDSFLAAFGTLKDGPGLRATVPTAERHFLNPQEN